MPGFPFSPERRFTVYRAAEGFEAQLREELSRQGVVAHPLGAELIAAPGPARELAWAQNLWLEPRLLSITSISDAARQLRGLGRNWILQPLAAVRRSKLIEQRLPVVRPKPLAFPSPPPSSPLGAWTLLDRDLLLASPTTSSPFPHGRARFVENRSDPPGRAYLKLWEALTLMGDRPKPGQRCLDLGASPGSWTWVASELGAEVISVDKAPLHRDIAARPNVTCLRRSAFGLEPEQLGKLDWWLSDVVCYPGRLIELVERWVEAKAADRMIATLKFQGDTDHDAAARLAAIPGSRLLHCSHNKHELTWMRRAG